MTPGKGVLPFEISMTNSQSWVSYTKKDKLLSSSSLFYLSNEPGTNNKLVNRGNFNLQAAEPGFSGGSVRAGGPRSRQLLSERVQPLCDGHLPVQPLQVLRGPLPHQAGGYQHPVALSTRKCY
jgi:hypothetical protein